MSKRRSASAAASAPPPAPGEGKRGADGHIGYLLRQAQGALRQAGDAELASLGLTLPQFAILTQLGAYGPLSGAQLARLAVQTPQTIDAVTKNLVRAGLVAKSPDPAHGRILRLALTAAGEAALAAAKRRVNALERRLVAGLGPGEERVVRTWLAGVARDLLPRG
ncbi:MAG: winged helix-turn-helix transcriptional regulator [Rhodospirillaceae bacterium]|nr:winged helix-turn-helix transcriptional regulator [Rhodospirillaceae bacterium]